MPDDIDPKWYKLDVVFKFIGGVLTAIAVATIAFVGSYTLERNQAMDTDTRLYADLMNKREEAETSLRKDMFNSIIGSFLKSKAAGVEEKVLNLELLVHNFNEVLDLAPLFKAVSAEIRKSKPPNFPEYLNRLEEAADKVKSKQIAALEDSGGKLDVTLSFAELKDKGEVELVSSALSFRSGQAMDPALLNTTFKVDVLAVDHIQKKIRVNLRVTAPRNANAATNENETDTISASFWISPFDFPMIDNTRLPRGQRCALVLTKMREDRADFTLVYFPASRASLKEKPFFDEAISDLLRTRNQSGQGWLR